MSSATQTEAKPKPVAKPSVKDYQTKFIPLTKISDVSINVRFKNNLDIRTMKDEIAIAGRVKDVIHLWAPAKDVAEQLGVADGQYVVIRGNRRTLASKAIVNEPDQWTASLVETVKTIPAYIHEGLTLTEAEEMVLDHNSMKRIAKSEIVNSIFRRYMSNKTEMDIILEMHRIIGEDLVGKADKVKELEGISDPKKRRDFARKWLHTFVGNYLIRSCKLGPFVRDGEAEVRLAACLALAVAGLCGALDPALSPGDVVVASELRDAAGAVHRCPGSEALLAELRQRGVSAHSGAILCVDHLVRGEERRRLADSGAIAVDMESLWLAEAAGDRPFAVLRVVVDTPDRELLGPWIVPSARRALRALGHAVPALEGWSDQLKGN